MTKHAPDSPNMLKLGAIVGGLLAMAAAGWWLFAGSSSKGPLASPEAEQATAQLQAAAAEADKQAGDSAPLPEPMPGGRKPTNAGNP